MFFTNISEYYHYIDSLQIEPRHLHQTIKNIIEMSKKLSRVDQNKILLEMNSLEFHLVNGKFIPLYSFNDENGNLISHPDMDSYNKEAIDYLMNRLKTIHNKVLKARISHIVWFKTKNYELGCETVDLYINLINNYIELDKSMPNEHYGIHVCYALSNLQYISFTLNFQIDNVGSLVRNLIFNPNRESSSFLKLRFDCINLLIDKVRKKKLKKELLKDIDLICYQTFKEGLDLPFAELYYDAGCEISKILKNNTYNWDLEMANYYEKLMLNSNPIIAPEYCQKAIKLYEKLNDTKKVNNLYKKYSFLSTSTKYQTITSEKYDLSPLINTIKKFVNEQSSENIIKYLIYSNEIILDYNEAKTRSEEYMNKNSLFSLVTTIINDEYGHRIDVLDNESKKMKFGIYQDFNVQFDIKSKILYHLFVHSIAINKLNAELLLNYLTKNTWFGLPLEKKLPENKIYKYTWLDYISESITTGFSKIKNEIEGKNAIYYIQEIDSLTLKIEGIIIDLIEIFNIEGFKTFYFDNNDNYKWKNINNFIADDNIKNIIPENEIWTIKYLLIEYKNLRNRVAHSRLFMGEYNIYNFIYILILLLRLTKYNIK